jgi:uncharacterized SAM-binding protein YcdF (DUF218 family)
MKILLNFLFHAIIIISLYEKGKQIYSKLKSNREGKIPKQGISLDIVILVIMVLGFGYYYLRSIK